LTAGGSHALSVRRSPSTAISDTLSFSSSNTAVATVDGNGNVQALAAGRATITVETSRGAKSGCALTVTLPPPTDVTLSSSALTLIKGEKATLGGTVAPALADQSLSYTSSDEKVVSITPDGAVTALSAGKASITVSTVNGIKANCAVVVNDRPAVIVDISQHNYSTSMDWKKIAQNVDLLILRCGVTRTDTVPIGIDRDDRFEYYVQQCRAYDIPFGVYYYGKCSDAEAAVQEAEMTWAIAGRHNPLFYVYDAEEARLTRSVIETYIKTLKSLGAKKTGLYIAHHLYKKYQLDLTIVDFAWVPNYGKNTGFVDSSPAFSCDLHQYTSNGRIDGFPGRVDLNRLMDTKPLGWFLDYKQ
jgi:GH25 family lysozyme M1 (1,4-beta-N-acetylmuramidase)